MMGIEISDAMLRAVKMTEPEFRLETALWLYQQDRLTLAQAARWSGLTRLQFQRELAVRRHTVHFDTEELRHEIEALKEVGLK